MNLLVVGSTAFDTIETPFGRREHVLGGSAVHFSYSASFLASVDMVSIVGRDFPQEHVDLLKRKGIETSGIVRAEGNTFHWSGRYQGDMNSADTLEVNLNVFGDFLPTLTPAQSATPWVFLANGHPKTQMAVLDQARGARFVMADTMNLWISEARPDLVRLLARVNAVIMNDGEARMLTGEQSIIRSARALLTYGLQLAIIKKGEHGALAVTPDFVMTVPAYPTEAVVDPTGAGDSFAGGVLGYLSLTDEITPGTLRKALRYGAVLASFQVEDFGLDRLLSVTRTDIERRLIRFEAMI